MKVSVILTTCDRPEYLREAVASYIAQDYLDSELIIVNDGKDGLHEFPVEDRRVTLVRTGNPYSGQAIAINGGIGLAKGELIVWMCDDDLFYDIESLSNRAKLFTDESNTEAVFTAWEEIDAEGNPVATHTPGTGNVFALWKKETFNHLAGMWRKSIHDKIGPFNQSLKYFADYDFKLRCAMECEVLTSPLVTLKYRAHAGQQAVKRRNTPGATAEENRKMRDALNARYGGIFQ